MFSPPLALPAGKGIGYVKAAGLADVLIRVPGHHALMPEQPVQEGQLRVAALL